MARYVKILIYPGFVLLDLAGPMEAFGIVSHEYRVAVTSLGGGLVKSSCGLEVMSEPFRIEACDTLIVSGAPVPPAGEMADALSAVISATAPRARRTASICTGAFLLAQSGVLDKRSATTHWYYANKLKAMFPALRVDGDRIFTEDGGVWTAAGMSAGIDMTLAMIEEDHGKQVAQGVARMMVVYYRRPAGQYQFSSLVDFDPGSDRIRKTLSYARENLAGDLSVERLAEIAALSVRQFARTFTASTGMTPAKAIERLRLDAARPMVEDGRRTFEEIARLVGFADPERMCQSFLRAFGTTPQDIRRLARQNTPEEGSMALRA